MVQALELLGALPVVIPAIRISPPQTWAAADKALREIESYDWLVFTSVNGVGGFLDRYDRLFESRFALTELRIGVIGAATRQRLESESLVVSLQPARGIAEELARELVDAVSATVDPKDVRVLLPTSSIARDILPRALKQVGCVVDVIEVYRTEPAQISTEHLRFQFESAGVDDIVFASPSAVRSFAKSIRDAGHLEKFCRARIVCIGEVTAAAVREEGLVVGGIAHEPTVECVIDALSASDSNIE